MSYKGIAGLVFSDLEAEEIPDCLAGFGIGGADQDTSSSICELDLVEHLLAPALQNANAGRRLVVDKHRYVKITGAKSTGDVLKVHSDLVDAGFVVGRVGADLDHSAMFGQQKMMSDFLLVKAHALVAALLEGLVGGGLRCVLGGRGNHSEEQEKSA